MEYSKFKSLRVKNFRNIGDVTLDFTKSPIIALVGENEAGKTSFIKALAVLGLHADVMEQKAYIKDGTPGFGIVAELEDGTVVTRVKNNATNLYAIDKPNGDKWSINKIDAGLPTQVRNTIGFIEEPETKEYLHIRTYEDKLLFVVTPSSTNYKVMYNALKVEQLTTAIKRGSNRVNELRNLFDKSESSMNTLLEEIRKIRIYDIEPLVNIKNRLKKELGQIAKLDIAMDMVNTIKSLRAKLGIAEQLESANIHEIDLVYVNKLADIYRNIKRRISIVNSLSLYNNVYALENIDINSLIKVKSIVDLGKKHKQLSNITQSYMELSKISEISIDDVRKLRDAKDKRDRIQEISRGIEVYKDTNLMQSINISDIPRLKLAVSKLYNIKALEMSINAVDIKNAERIEEKDIVVINKSNRVFGMIDRIGQINAQITGIDNERARLTDLIKETGAIIAECPKCGEAVVVDARAYA